MHRRRAVFLAVLTTLVLLVSLVMPVTAHADDPAPPPDAPATEEAPPAEQPAETDLAPAAEQNAEQPTSPAEGTTTDEVAAQTEATAQEGAAASESAIEQDPPAAENVAPEVLPAEEVTVPEVLAAAPEGTEVVVLDAAGEQLPLASTEAAEIVASGDPVWCPAGQKPGGSDCSPAQSDLQAIVDWMATADFAGTTDSFTGGTIWIEEGDDGSPAYVLLDANVSFDTMEHYPLTFQGGWNGVFDNAGVITSTPSTLHHGLVVINWNADITLNDLIVMESDSGGAYIETSGNIAVNDSQFTQNAGDGLYAGADGNVEINQSDFSKNRSNGLTVGAGGNLTLTGVTASGNEGESFMGMSGFGILGGALGDATLTDVTATDNYLAGVVAGAMGDASLTRVEASDNGGIGVAAGAIGDLTLADVTANVTGEHNSSIGVVTIALGDATLNGVDANGNSLLDVAALSLGDASLTDVTASDSQLGVVAASLGGLPVLDILEFGLGGLIGGGFPVVLGLPEDVEARLLEAEATPGEVTLNRVIADNNDVIGGLAFSGGNVFVENSEFSGNETLGLVALGLGNTSLAGVTANENSVGVVAASLGGLPLGGILGLGQALLSGGFGGGVVLLPGLGIDPDLTLPGTPGTTSLAGVTADNNEYVGVLAGALGDTSFTNVYARNNGLVGGLAVSGGDLFVGDSDFSSNGFLGLGAVSLLDGDVTIFRILANGNDGVGVALGSMTTQLFPEPAINPSTTGSVQLMCSVVTGNTLEGLAAGSNTVISSNDLSGNGGGEYQEYFGATVTEGPLVDCEALNEWSDYMANRRAELLAGPACPDVTLREGDVTAVLHNLCGHDVGLTSPEPSATLPSAASLSSHVTIVGEDLPVTGGFITLSFPIPPDADPANLAVLFWDGAQWSEVPGGSVANGMFVVDVTEDGVHALVQQ